MRRFAWIAPFALAALVACTDTGGEAGGTDMEAGAAEADGGDAAAPAASTSASALACTPTAGPDELAERLSPYDSVSIAVGQGAAKICYSRPYLKGRTMLGGASVPWGQLWRFGANEPTIIHLDTPASIAGAEVEPGAYSLYVVPEEQGDWTLIVNRSTSQWGHEGQYTPEVQAQEIGRFPIRSETVEQPIEQFTIRPDPGGRGIVAEWQNSRVFIPIAPAS